MSWSGYEDDIDLESLIQGAIDDWAQGRRAFWKDNPENAYVDLVDEIAKKVFTASSTMSVPDPGAGDFLDWSAALQLTDIPPIYHLMFERVQIDVAWEFATGTDAMAGRCMDLTKLVLKTRPPEHILRFLSRVSRCFIAGFEPETVVMCRAVLENAVKTAATKHNVGDARMKERLRALHDLGILSEQGRAAAWTVWTRGNTAVHQDPTVTTAVFETIELTATVLAELEPAIA